MPDSNLQYRLVGHEREFEGRRPRVPVWIEAVLATRLTEDELREPHAHRLVHPQPRAAGHHAIPVSDAEATRLLELCEEHGATVEPDM